MSFQQKPSHTRSRLAVLGAVAFCMWNASGACTRLRQAQDSAATGLSHTKPWQHITRPPAAAPCQILHTLQNPPPYRQIISRLCVSVALHTSVVLGHGPDLLSNTHSHTLSLIFFRGGWGLHELVKPHLLTAEHNLTGRHLLARRSSCTFFFRLPTPPFTFLFA